MADDTRDVRTYPGEVIVHGRRYTECLDCHGEIGCTSRGAPNFGHREGCRDLGIVCDCGGCGNAADRQPRYVPESSKTFNWPTYSTLKDHGLRNTLAVANHNASEAARDEDARRLREMRRTPGHAPDCEGVCCGGGIGR